MLLPWITLILIFSHCCFASERSYNEIDVEPCDIDRCRLPYCYCASQKIPGGLTVRDTPQFIALTITGPLNEKAYDLLEDLFLSKKYSNPDGCPISSTVFLKNHAETNYCLLKRVLHYENIELSITSNSSECPTVDCRVKEKDDKSPYVTWRSYRFYNETIDYRRTISKLLDRRPSSIVGYRSPNYEVNNNQLHWHILREHQFLYDSTLITREWDTPYYKQQQPTPLTWPHTMDFKANYDCSQGCYTQSFPGLWTIPIHMYQDLDGRNCTTIGSDHCRVPRVADKFFKYLKYNLNRHLYSNHAPFVMAFDSYWLNEPYTAWRIEGLKLFLEHVLRHHSNDVYFVRMIDIINWVKQPVGLKQMKEGYLDNIALRSKCHKQIDIDEDFDQQCIDGKIMKNSKLNATANARSLLLLFDVAAEPLFRSNIVFYSSISFGIFLIVTFIYDRISVS
ncbi:unnamed protein product [Adineta steineri]|uniref:Uncharacterized protein n=1 Tax=Adineta steineri TaxID=433720 RepID=A0A818S5W8_9BILA|nr:unnamed protein product [Adineta steineri]CAF1307999.1 unnamed protein product [Adineta steineri]CAF3509918.1 unnamed protein product [Adineta steineri]CAF3666955.1 unnamed protein product [Adineta steineri]